MNQKQTALLQALLTEPTITKAAERAGISRAAAYKYMHDEEFKANLEKQKQEVLDSVTTYLQGQLTTCSEELMGIAKDRSNSPQVRINAIAIVFQNARSFIEQESIIKRIAALEEMAEGGDLI